MPLSKIVQSSVDTPVAGTGPAFGAYLASGAGQSISANVDTKVTLDVEEFDTNNNFISSRFTPTVAGYYQLNGCVAPNTSGTRVIPIIRKNGSEARRGADITSSNLMFSSTVNAVLYANGTTDYFELYVFTSAASTLYGGSPYTYFNGFLARAA